jgi:hypothetical protein
MELEFINTHGEIAFAKEYGKCPLCGEQLQHVEGCISCVDGCGFTKCG